MLGGNTYAVVLNLLCTIFRLGCVILLVINTRYMPTTLRLVLIHNIINLLKNITIAQYSNRGQAKDTLTQCHGYRVNIRIFMPDNASQWYKSRVAADDFICICGLAPWL